MPAGIYIHVPFCERKCAYCNFNTTDFLAELASEYVRAVSKEINRWGQKLSEGEGEPGAQRERVEVDTIYLGGGTPSILEAEQVGTLIEACNDSFHIAAPPEVTIEINPGTFARQKLESWREAGVNRVSVGVQSFIDGELVSLSRTHSAADARRTIEALREAGFENLSLDLIAGFPDQSEADWEFNLGEALRLRPEHLSLYLLEVKEGTRLACQIGRGLRSQPDDDIAAQMYRKICEATRANGYEHYEISNFARREFPQDASPKPRSYRSKHNMKYWTGAPFYGMGCGAYSYDGRVRWVNIRKTECYIESIDKDGVAIAERSELSDKERFEEALFMALRLSEGVALDDFEIEYGVDVLDRYGGELKRFEEAGLVSIDNGRLRLTETGMLLSNEVFVAFV